MKVKVAGALRGGGGGGGGLYYTPLVPLSPNLFYYSFRFYTDLNPLPSFKAVHIVVYFILLICHTSSSPCQDNTKIDITFFLWLTSFVEGSFTLELV